MKHYITRSERLEITPTEFKSIGMAFIESLTEERWIRDGKVMEEHATSHRFDAAIGNVDDPKFAINVAAIRLKNLLK